MPRSRKGARLWFRPERVDKDGVLRQGSWFIRDAGRQIATGFGKGQDREAEQALSSYITDKYQVERRERLLAAIPIADVIGIFLDDRTPTDETQAHKLAKRLGRLLDFWGEMTLDAVTGANCRAYARHRGNDGGARRDLEDLRAAINHHAKEGLHRAIVRVVLPEKSPPRERWLTRSEAARLVWVCWRAREEQKRHRGPDKGKTLPTDKRPLRHLARFILLGLYTGSRAGAIATASFHAAAGRSYVDLESGIFYRRAEGRRITNKRQPPVPLPPRLLAHIRRWKDRKIAASYVVEWHGLPVKSVKTAFKTAVIAAKLPGKVSPHTLRHTAATWLMQAGTDKWEAAGFLGMSVETLDRVYGHHHPDYLQGAAQAIGTGRRRATAGPPKQADQT